MKKILAILLVAIVFLNCSNDDNNAKNEKEVNPLIGKWVLDRIEVNDKPIPLTACDLQNAYVFEEETATQFLSKEVDQDCIETRFDGTWLIGGNGFITVKFNLPRDAAFIVMNDEETEIDELVKFKSQDGLDEIDAMYVYKKQ